MKKLTALFVALMFIISIVPLALAEDVADDSTNGTTENVEVTTTSENIEIDTKDDKIREQKEIRQPREGPNKNFTKEQRFENIKEKIEKDKDKIKELKEKRNNISDKIKERVGEDRLRIAEHLSEKNPKFIGFIANMTDAEKEVFLNLDRSQQEKVMKEGRESLKDFKIRKVKKEEAFQKREITKDKLEKAKENFKKAEEKYKESSEKYNEAKEKFEKSLKSRNETEQKTQAKEFLTKAADMIIQSIEKVKEKAQESNDLTEQEVKKITTEADAKIAEMTVLKQKLADAQTKDEIKAAGQAILKSWETTKLAIKEHAEKVVEGKVGEIIERSESLERKLETILANMEAKNISIEGLDEKVSKFSIQIETARSLFKEGQDALNAAKDARTNNMTQAEKDAIKADIDTAQAKIKEAHETLKAAHETLSEIAKEIKSKGGSFEVEEETEEVVVEHVESEENENEVETESETEVENEIETENEITTTTKIETESEQEKSTSNNTETEDDDEIKTEDSDSNKLTNESVATA